VVARQYEVFLVNLDPTVSQEIRKTRPCLVVSPDEMNRSMSTLVVAPLTTVSRNYPTRVRVGFQKRDGWIVLDQLRTIDTRRLARRLGRIGDRVIAAAKSILSEMLVE